MKQTNQTASTAAEIESLARKISDHLQQQILPFWLRFARDNENGGFWGRLAADGSADKSAAKGLVQHARFLWSFSAFYEQHPCAEFSDFADHAYQFLTQHFYDNLYGGYFYQVTVNGEPLVSEKHIFAHGFVIYSLARYTRVFARAEVRQHALEVVTLLQRFARDRQWTGYQETFTRDWQPTDQLADFGVTGRRKTMNSHLHLMVAFTELYRIVPVADVRDSLQELVDLFLDIIYDPRRQSLGMFFEPDWHRIDASTSFGHDIETAWLLIEASRTLDDYRWEDVRSTALNLITQVLANGLDRQKGGVFSEKNLTDCDKTNSDPLNRKKVWWVQAEALVGFLTAFQLTGKRDYWDAFHNVLNWIFNFQADRELGDWYSEIDANGRVQGDKASLWKTPYHNGRACLEVLHRLNDLLHSTQ